MLLNLNVNAPVALLAQKIPGFSSACTTPPSAGCPVLYGDPAAL